MILMFDLSLLLNLNFLNTAPVYHPVFLFPYLTLPSLTFPHLTSLRCLASFRGLCPSAASRADRENRPNLFIIIIKGGFNSDYYN